MGPTFRRASFSQPDRSSARARSVVRSVVLCCPASVCWTRPVEMRADLSLFPLLQPQLWLPTTLLSPIFSYSNKPPCSSSRSPSFRLRSSPSSPSRPSPLPSSVRARPGSSTTSASSRPAPSTLACTSAQTTLPRSTKWYKGPCRELSRRLLRRDRTPTTPARLFAAILFPRRTGRACLPSRLRTLSAKPAPG
jgi:hypothetical protein